MNAEIFKSKLFHFRSVLPENDAHILCSANGNVMQTYHSWVKRYKSFLFHLFHPQFDTN